MKITVLDAARFGGKAAAHEYIASALSFPEYYGKNLDALADCLSELPRDRGVIITNTRPMCEYAEAVCDVFVEILKPSGRVILI